jgi:hypothetical protein
MKGISMSATDVEAHQRRHGFMKGGDASCALRPNSVQKNAGSGAVTSNPKAAPKPRQNATEREYGLILEAMKRRGEILDYRPFGIRLEWGCDPQTGKPMVYSPDFTVRPRPTFEDSEHLWDRLPLTLVEVKGGFIRPQDLIRWKGCRAEWPMFRFELHQKTKEGWRRVL